MFSVNCQEKVIRAKYNYFLLIIKCILRSAFAQKNIGHVAVGKILKLLSTFCSLSIKNSTHFISEHGKIIITFSLR